MAAPTYIPIKGDIGTHSGALGIVKVHVTRETELAALYPPRQPYQPVRQEPRPFYYDGAGVFQYMVQCTNPNCMIYQRRTAFGPDKRKRNGLRSWCRSCEAESKRLSRKTA